VLSDGLRVDLKVGGGLEMEEDAKVTNDSPRIGLLGAVGFRAGFSAGKEWFDGTARRASLFTEPVLLRFRSEVCGRSKATEASRVSPSGKAGYRDDTAMSGVSSSCSDEDGSSLARAALGQGSLEMRYCPGDNLGNTT